MIIKYGWITFDELAAWGHNEGQWQASLYFKYIHSATTMKMRLILLCVLEYIMLTIDLFWKWVHAEIMEDTKTRSLWDINTYCRLVCLWSACTSGISFCGILVSFVLCHSYNASFRSPDWYSVLIADVLSSLSLRFFPE